VARLMDRELYDLLVTDPPYGVSYGEKNRFLNRIGKGNRIQAAILGDEEPPEQMFAFWHSISVVRLQRRKSDAAISPSASAALPGYRW